MRYLAAALVLVACAPDLAPAGDAGADAGTLDDLGAADTGATDVAEDGGQATDADAVDASDDTGPTADDPPVEDAGAVDSGTDVVRVDGAPCIPACPAGSVCVGGVCDAVDGGADAGAVDSGPPRPIAEPQEFQSCEPRGTSCGGDAGVTCVRPDRTTGDAGARGACLRPCAIGVESDCPEGSRCVPNGGGDTGYCAIPCPAGQIECGGAGTVCEFSTRDVRQYCL